MARTSYQRGFIQEKNGRYTLRYRIRDSRKGWREKRESLPPGTSHKDALQMLDKRIKAANALNNDAQRIACRFDVGPRDRIAHPGVLLLRLVHERLVEHEGYHHQHEASGDAERESAAARGAVGIPIDDNTWAQLREAGMSVGMSEAAFAA